jgi:trigger factor
MKIAVEEVSSTKRALRIEVPPERLLDRLDAAYRHLSRDVRLPGFRPGRAPREVLRLHLKEEATREALRELIPESYAEALKGTNLDPISDPHVDEVICEEGRPLSFRASFDVRPALQPSGYTGVVVHRERVEVSEPEIDQALEALRQRAAEYVPMDGWPALREDLVVVDYEGFLGGKPLKGVKGQNVSILLGARQFIPEFEEHLHGLRKGDRTEFGLEFPADYGRRELAGRRVLFKVTVKDLKKKRVPPLDDGFARSVGDCQGLSELREKVRRDLVAHKEREQVGRLKQEILDTLLAQHPFDAPDSLVEVEVEQVLEEVKRSLAVRAGSPAWIEEELARHRQKAVELATKRVRASLFLEALARHEQLDVSEDEVHEEVRSLAAAFHQDAATFGDMLRRQGRLEGIRGRLLERKTLDFLYQRANVVDGVNLVTLA